MIILPKHIVNKKNICWNGLFFVAILQFLIATAVKIQIPYNVICSTIKCLYFHFFSSSVYPHYNAKGSVLSFMEYDSPCFVSNSTIQAIMDDDKIFAFW